MYCDAAFVFPWQLKRHGLTHAEDRPIFCSQCSAKFKYHESLKAHVRAAHMKERNHSCGASTRTFEEDDAAASHVSSRHSEDEASRKFECGVCGDTFGDRSALNRHKRTRPERHSSQQYVSVLFCKTLFTADRNCVFFPSRTTRVRMYVFKLGFQKREALLDSIKLTVNSSCFAYLCV